jgi:hypothetical protein
MGYTVGMPFIQFPFIKVPPELRKIVGEPTPGTRAYRQEGTYKECGAWFEALGAHYNGDVGLSTNAVIMFVPVSRAGVHKRIREGKLTAFFFYVTQDETTLFGAKRKAKDRPFIVVSVSECKAWATELKRRVNFVDDPKETPIEQSYRLLPASEEDEPRTDEELREVLEFTEIDPNDKGNRKVRYRKTKDPVMERYGQQDLQYKVAAAMAALVKGGEGAERYRKRLQNGLKWNEELKTWSWKD